MPWIADKVLLQWHNYLASLGFQACFPELDFSDKVYDDLLILVYKGAAADLYAPVVVHSIVHVLYVLIVLSSSGHNYAIGCNTRAQYRLGGKNSPYLQIDTVLCQRMQ